MERYDSYKDSGVDWIGQIPEHWETFRIKNVAKLFSGNGFPINIQGNHVGDYPVYKAGDLNKPSVYIDQSSNYISNNILAQYKFTKIPSNSILFPKIGEAMKKNGRKINLSSCCIDNNCSAFNVINDNVNILFFYYYLKIVDMAYFDNGGAIPCLNTSRLLSAISIVPPLSEQQAIVAYLDKETGKLDAAVEKLERMVEVLKERKQLIISKAVTRGLEDSVPLKDSGVEWIGQIPEHWAIYKFNYVISQLTDYTANGSFGDLAKNVKYKESGYARLIRLTDLRTNLKYDQSIWIDESAYNYLAKSKLYGGELLLANVGAYSGLVKIMPNVQYPSSLAPNMFLIKTKADSIQTPYIFYLLSSSIYFKWLQVLAMSSAAQPKLNKDNIRNIPILFPTLTEQQAIAAYLDEKVGKLDEAIEKQLRMIELLKERKQILISDVVTGKIKVA